MIKCSRIIIKATRKQKCHQRYHKWESQYRYHHKYNNKIIPFLIGLQQVQKVRYHLINRKKCSIILNMRSSRFINNRNRCQNKIISIKVCAYSKCKISINRRYNTIS